MHLLYYKGAYSRGKLLLSDTMTYTAGSECFENRFVFKPAAAAGCTA